MADKIQLEIVTPEGSVLSKAVDDVTLPSVDGYMGVLHGHTPLLARLDVGEISYLEAGQRHYLAASGGFVEVLRESVTILARTSEPAEEIDLERAERARDKAQQMLNAQEHAEQQLRKAEVHLKRAISRIQVHGRAHR